jgi:hypothetical protein
MRVPWLSIFKTILGVSGLVQAAPRAKAPAASLAGRTPSRFETRLAGVLVSALKEAFDRDSRRIEFERERMEAERLHAERMLRLDLLRQVCDREISRLRLLTGVAAGCWLGSLFFSLRVAGAGVGAKVSLGGGWLLLLTALVVAFRAQARVIETLRRGADISEVRPYEAPSAMGRPAPWFLGAGLALVCLSVLLM